MNITGVVGFCTETEVDDRYPSDADWLALTSEEKEDAINSATVYLQSHYNCGLYSTDYEYQQSEVDVRLKDSCAYLATQQIRQSLFDRQDQLGALVEKEVGAGPTKTRKKYQSGKSWIDPFPQITAYLSGFFPLTKSSGGIYTVNKLRG